MMNLKRFLFFVAVIAIMAGVNGCSKFLDILPPSQSVNPTTIKEFQEMLNNDSLATVHFFMLDLMTDDAALTNTNYSTDNFFKRAHAWEATVWDPAQEDYIYSSCYSRILQMNIILERIKVAPADELNTPQNNSIVTSQALINRAYYYFQLVNTYGPAYDASTSTTDLGVPLILMPNADVLPVRATVEQVYNSIIDDLKKAVDNEYLPAKGVDIIHPGKAAGYALLARTYLYKGDYTSALAYANLALGLESRLMDLSTLTTYFPGQLLDLVPNPEVLVGRIGLDASYYLKLSGMTIGQSLLDSLGGLSSTDRRYTQKFSGRSYRLYTANTRMMAQDNSISVPEVMLIKAECLARQGDVTGASTLLTALRSKRMPAAAVVSTRNYNAGNILQYVIGERRRELAFRGGLRLFDLKRLNKDIRFKQDIIRQNEQRTLTLATLPAGSRRYLLPFSANVIAANPNIVQNQR